MRLSGLLPLLRLCDGSFRRAERDETELLLLTPQHQREPRASRGCEVPARPSRNLALQCLDRHRSGSCGGVSLQMSKLPTPRGLPFAFKLFGLPLVFLGGLVSAFWPVSSFTNVFSAAFIVLAWLPLIGAIITFALRKIDLKTFLIVALVFGFPFLPFVFAGVVGFFRGH